MRKLHLSNLLEQIAAKGHGLAPFHYWKSKSFNSIDNQDKPIINDTNNEIKDYQINQEKIGLQNKKFD